tara:strand:- start:3318 stop:5039 length:1722 start_codon:yes stop_codon:yes gene_type:complete
MLQFIRRYVLVYWPYYCAGFFALIATNYVATVIPLYIQEAVDLLADKGDFDYIQPFLLKIIGFACLLAIVRTLSRVLIFFPGRFVEYDLRDSLFSHLLGLSETFYQKQKIGDLISRMINDVQSLRATAALGFLHIINTIMIYSFVIVQMTHIHPGLTFWVVLPIPLAMGFVGFFVKYMYLYTYQCQQALGDITNFFVEMFSNIKVIKTSVAEEAVLTLFHQKNDDYVFKNIQLAKVRAGMFPFIGIIGSIGSFVLLLLGGKLIINSALTVGEFVAMGTYIGLLAWPTASLAWIINIIQRGKAAWSRLADILDETNDFKGELVIDESDSLFPITCQHLSYVYDDTTDPVLKDINITIQKGQVIGFFGPSGSGKSTLINILSGSKKVADEQVMIGGRCLNTLSISAYQAYVSAVSQNPFLFSASIHDNISFFSDHDESLRLLTDQACVTDDITRFPAGFNTLIGEKGVVLSGGQRSRVALARAFYKSSSLLLLDDIVSAVDHDTEQQMIANIMAAKLPEQALVMVSHRVSALLACDCIYVFQNGSIIDAGTHDELIKKEGLYAYTWRYQKLVDQL